MSVQGPASRRSDTVASPLLTLGVFLFTLALPHLLFGQNAAQSQPAADQGQTAFKLRVERNVVVVRAVVRDAKGNTVRNLQKEDFRLFDNGKPQVITHFSAEGPALKPPAQQQGGERRLEPGASSETGQAPAPSLRYTGLYFDDVHAEFEELVHARDAADRYLASTLQPSDRVGVFTTSGQNVVDFTDDRAKIHEALFRLRPRPIVLRSDNTCPQIFDYQAYQMVHERDPFAIEIATDELFECNCRQLPQSSWGNCRDEARQAAEGEAFRVWNSVEQETDYTLRGLEQLVRRMALLPGQRNIVLISPGFLTPTQKTPVNEIIDRALHSDVIISGYDAKGLFAPLPLGDASKQVVVLPSNAALTGRKAQLQLTSLQRAVEVLRDVSLDTGGEYFHDSNDFDGGFRRVSALPEIYYVLGFTPKDLKYDGHFHSIKVNVATAVRLTIQARRGYFAPRTSPDEATRAKEEIEQAVFSQDQLNELPVELHMQFFKTTAQDAKLSVLTHLDLGSLAFRKKDGRNLDNLTIVTALFDRDGKYLTANEKRVEFRLRENTLERYSRSGVTIKTSFDLKPGTYLVRQVVRDADGGQLSGQSRTIEIPF